MFGSNRIKKSIMKALSLVTFLCMIKIGDGQHLGVLGPELHGSRRDPGQRDDFQVGSGVAGLDPEPDPGSFTPTPTPLDLERKFDSVAGLALERDAGSVRKSPAKARAHFDEIYDPYLGTNRVERDPHVYVEGWKTVTRVLQSNKRGMSMSPTRSPTKGKFPTRSPTKGKSPTRSPTKGKSPTRSPTKGKSPTRSPTEGTGKEGYLKVLRKIDGKTVEVWRKTSQLKKTKKGQQ